MTLKSRWFDMIASGEKKEEYRDIKPYWTKRLINADGTFKHFDQIEFINGYHSDARRLRIECKGIKIGMSKPKWSDAPPQRVYIISLGRIL